MTSLISWEKLKTKTILSFSLTTLKTRSPVTLLTALKIQTFSSWNQENQRRNNRKKCNLRSRGTRVASLSLTTLAIWPKYRWLTILATPPFAMRRHLRGRLHWMQLISVTWICSACSTKQRLTVSIIFTVRSTSRMPTKFRISSKTRKSLNSTVMISKPIRKVWSRIFRREMVTTGSRTTFIAHQTEIMETLHPIHLLSKKKTFSMLIISRKSQLLVQKTTIFLQTNKKKTMISSIWFQQTLNLPLIKKQLISFLLENSKTTILAMIISWNLKTLTEKYNNISNVKRRNKL